MIPSLHLCNGTLWLQWFAAVTAMIMMFVTGLSLGWSSPFLAKFTSGDVPFSATADEISWMASIYQMGRIPGAICGAVCVHYLGSKTTIFVNGCSLLIAWILVIPANSAGWILASRFICGASFQVASICAPLYLGDISSSRIRGALVSLAQSGFIIGIVVGNAMGAYLSLKLFAWIALVPCVYFILTALWLPQSAYYLIGEKRMMDAKKSILKYDPKAEVRLEFESMRAFLAESNSMTFVDRLRAFNIPRNRKAGLVLIALCIFKQMSGNSAVAGFMESIMIRGNVTVIAPSTVPIIANSLGIMAGWLMVYFVEKYGRKIMWIVSCTGLCGAMLALGTHFYLIDHEFDPTWLQWLLIIAVLVDKTFVYVGVSPVPAVLLSELFAPNIRTLAGFVFSLSSAIFGFLSIYFYQYLIARIAEAYVWWIYAFIMLVALIFGTVFVEDMKGKSLMEIQDKLMKK